ncbi:MAG: hypothetical protein AB7F86_10005 [Bdellovibrionales bacterium]
MQRKLQVILNSDSWAVVEGLLTEANDDFQGGSITYSDLVNEMICAARIDIKALQLKHTNIRKSLRSLAAQKDIDVDLAIKSLMELKTKATRKTPKPPTSASEEIP